MISPHFSERELLSRGTWPQKRLNVYRLAAHLEALRADVGRALPIISGFRTPTHNAQVGGAPESMHLEALAADMHPGLVTVNQAEDAGFMGIGTKGGWVTHVDLRANPARWTY